MDDGDGFPLSTAVPTASTCLLFPADEGLNFPAVLVCLQPVWTTMNPVYSPASAGVPFTNTKGLGYPGNR